MREREGERREEGEKRGERERRETRQRRGDVTRRNELRVLFCIYPSSKRQRVACESGEIAEEEEEEERERVNILDKSGEMNQVLGGSGAVGEADGVLGAEEGELFFCKLHVPQRSLQSCLLC